MLLSRKCDKIVSCRREIRISPAINPLCDGNMLVVGDILIFGVFMNIYFIIVILCIVSFATGFIFGKKRRLGTEKLWFSKGIKHTLNVLKVPEGHIISSVSYRKIQRRD